MKAESVIYNLHLFHFTYWLANDGRLWTLYFRARDRSICTRAC